MNKKNDYLIKLQSEMIFAARKRNFKDMSEIYNEIEYIKYNKHTTTRIFFSELDENFSVRLPYRFKELRNKDKVDALIYPHSNLLEIYYTPLDLINWQKDFIKNDVGACYEKINVISDDVIFIGEEILHTLEWYVNDIMMIEVSNSIIISKFEPGNWFF